MLSGFFLCTACRGRQFRTHRDDRGVALLSEHLQREHRLTLADALRRGMVKEYG